MSKTKTLAPPQRNQAIDALRGIACIFVLLVHVTLPGSVGIGLDIVDSLGVYGHFL